MRASRFFTLQAVVLLELLPRYVEHPLSSQGPNFWGGIGGDIGELTIATAILASSAQFYSHHRCHVRRCWRLSWHPDPVTLHPVCRRHHPDGRGIVHRRARA